MTTEHDPRDWRTYPWQANLAWRFGQGAVLVLPSAVVMPRSGVLGNGTSVPAVSAPDEYAMARFGFCERVLRPLSPIFIAALARAYGDEGEAWTNDQRWPHWRWKAVAPLTRQAKAQGEAWAKGQPRKTPTLRERRDPNTGPASVRWCDHLLNQRQRSPEEEAAFVVLEAQSQNLLAAAEEAFAESHRLLAHRPPPPVPITQPSL